LQKVEFTAAPKLPAAQGVQELAPARLKVPAAHTVGANEFAGHAEPAGHDTPG
jgi:hypothetical protein